jgi:hypothetical protein
MCRGRGRSRWTQGRGRATEKLRCATFGSRANAGEASCAHSPTGQPTLARRVLRSQGEQSIAKHVGFGSRGTVKISPAVLCTRNADSAVDSVQTCYSAALVDRITARIYHELKIFERRICLYPRRARMPKLSHASPFVRVAVCRFGVWGVIVCLLMRSCARASAAVHFRPYAFVQTRVVVLRTNTTK